MAALMDLRLFKLGLLVGSMALMFLAAGMIVFGTRLEIVRANAVAVLSVMVWLGCVVSVMRRWFCPKRSYKVFGRTGERRGTYEKALAAWMSGRMATEFHFKRLISDPSDSMVHGVLLIGIYKCSTGDVSTSPQ